MKTNKCSRINHENLGVLAAQGVTRALEARKVPMTPLTSADLEKVTGGIVADEKGRGCTEQSGPAKLAWDLMNWSF